MDDDDYNWSLETRNKCTACGHIELNEDKEDNKFVVFTEKLHSDDGFGSITTWTQKMCPKCNHLIVDRW